MGEGDGEPGGDRFDRRTFLRGAGAIAAAGLVSLTGAGLLDGDGSAGPSTTVEGTPGSVAGIATERTPTADRPVETEEDRPAETAAGRPFEGPVVGANLNGRPHRLNDALHLLDASETTWMRAFLDVRAKMERGTDPREDPDVVALRRAAREHGCRLIVSLKWDFKANWGDKPQMRVPEPGSNGEEELCRWGGALLAAIGEPVDVVVLGNEPMWETLDADVKVEDPPIVKFTRAAKDHLVRDGDHGEPTYLAGAFNRGHDDYLREQAFPHFYREMTAFVREDPDVKGVDLHLHFDGLSQAEAMIANAREAFPEEVITATEFSPVWRYDRNVYAPIADSDAGAAFAREHDLPGGMTAVEYFEDAKRNPRSAEELAEFYEAMPWYNVDHIEDVYALLEKYDVSVGTFGFLADRGMRNEDWTERWTPFHVNFLYQPAMLDDEAGVEHTANLHYLEDYRRRSR